MAIDLRLFQSAHRTSSPFNFCANFFRNARSRLRCHSRLMAARLLLQRSAMQQHPKPPARRARALAGIVLREAAGDVEGPADIGQVAIIAEGAEDVDVSAHAWVRHPALDNRRVSAQRGPARSRTSRPDHRLRAGQQAVVAGRRRRIGGAHFRRGRRRLLARLAVACWRRGRLVGRHRLRLGRSVRLGMQHDRRGGGAHGAARFGLAAISVLLPRKATGLAVGRFGGLGFGRRAAEQIAEQAGDRGRLVAAALRLPWPAAPAAASARSPSPPARSRLRARLRRPLRIGRGIVVPGGLGVRGSAPGAWLLPAT